MDTTSTRLRLSILAVVTLTLFGALFARLWYLQVMVADQLQVQGTANQIRTVAIEAPRGRILDDKGRVLVDNRAALVVTINPHDLAKLTKAQQADLLLRVATRLTDAGMPTKVSTIHRRLDDPANNPLQPVVVAIDVPEDLFLSLSERADEYPSVAVERRSVRHYPNGTLAANVVGYVGRVSEDELKAKQGGLTSPRPIPKPYLGDSEIGKTGVERAFEDYLRGTPGVQTVEVDAKNRPIRVTDTKAPQAGDDVVLTIDLDAQASAESALAQQLASLQGKTQRDGTAIKAPAGSAVAIDPNNGNVVALASFPTFDPAEFVNGISTDRYDELTKAGDQHNPLIDRALLGQYAPGSTFKVVTSTAALNTGLITAATTYNDTGSYHIQGCAGGTCTARNAGGERFGVVNLSRALTVSSDAFFYSLGDRFFREYDRLGPAIQDTARSYGLGSPTGIPLPPEGAGFMPDKATVKARYESAPNVFSKDPFSVGENVNVSVGQGSVLVSPLQLANVYATFANHGTVYQPQILSRIVRSRGALDDPAALVLGVQPVVKSHVDLPDSTWDPIMRGLQGVIDDPAGTGHTAFAGFDTKAYPLAGKTGTAQVDGKADTSLFASFGPVGAPKYAIVAVLEESGFGADAAAPVVRHVWETLTGQVPTAVAPQQTGIIG